MKNLFGKWSSLSSNRKSLYFSAFMIICFFVVLPVFSAHAGWSDEFGEAITQRLVSWVNTVIFEILKIILSFAGLLVYFGAWMVDVMLNQALYRSVLVGTTAADGTTAVSAVELGWRTVRDFCNMFYVFFLLIIAFGTITRSSTYNYKNLLPKFIISLFLINFSRVITEIAIDIGQIFLFGMAAWLGTFSGSSGGGAALTGIVNYFTMQFSGLQTPGFQDIISILFAVVYTFVLGIMYIILALFLLFRLIMFAVLIIASPFAFFSIVMPQTRRFANEWQGMLINNAISGPVFIFFIYISAMMAKTLTDNPISVTAADGTVSTDVSGLGDTSKMEYLVPTLTVLIPHIVALGMLFMAIPAAKRVGAFGQQYIVGGRGGIGKVAGWGYAGFKLGERSARRAASGTWRGANWGWDAGKKSFSSVADASDRMHGAYQDKIGKVPIVGVNMALQDKANQAAAKKKLYDDALKNAGGDLKAIDVELALKGDNVRKAIGLMAAAEQGILGKVDDKGESVYKKHFADASSILSTGQVKELTNKNLAFAPLLAENQNKTKDSFDEAGQTRIKAAVAMGYSEEDAIRQEIMRTKAVELVEKGKDDEIQGLDQAVIATAVAGAYQDKGVMDNIKKQPVKQRIAITKGLEAQAKEVQDRYDKAKTVEGKNAAQEVKINIATAAIKAGSRVDNALALDDTKDKDLFQKQANETFKNLSTADVTSLHKDDLKSHAHRATVDHIKDLRQKKNGKFIAEIKKSIDNASANDVDNKQEKEDVINTAMLEYNSKQNKQNP